MVKLSASLEDYIEAVYTEVLKNGCAKVTDIANNLNVKKASVSGALNQLKKLGLIIYEPYSAVTLTEDGIKHAKIIFQKHVVLADFFENVLYLPKDEAIQNACKVEHVMPKELFSRLNKFSIFIKEYLSDNPDLKAKVKKILN